MATTTKNRILIINAHPGNDSFCSEVSKRYLRGAQQSKAIVDLINLTDFTIDWSYSNGYKNNTDEAEIKKIQNLIRNASHLVIVFPNWWGTYPAILKGFIDRVFIPDFAYKYQKNSQFPIPLLKGKSARLIMSMDTPIWYYSLFYKSPGLNSLKKSILNFCGIKPVKTTIFTSVKKSTEEKRNSWLKKIEELGAKSGQVNVSS